MTMTTAMATATMTTIKAELNISGVCATGEVKRGLQRRLPPPA
jgi:hypothetical protein